MPTVHGIQWAFAGGTAGAVVVFVAALFRGFTGFGFALSAVPLLSLFISPSKAVPIAVGLQFLGGIAELNQTSRSCHWPSLRWMIAGAAVGSPIGAYLLHTISPSVARLIISVITALAVTLLSRGLRLNDVPSSALTIGTGAIAGLFNGIAAMPGPPAVLFYMSGPFQKAPARSSLLVFFLATSTAAILSLGYMKLIDLNVCVTCAVSLPIMFVGMYVGASAYKRSSDALHRHVSICCLGVISLVGAIKGLMELLN